MGNKEIKEAAIKEASENFMNRLKEEYNLIAQKPLDPLLEPLLRIHLKNHATEVGLAVLTDQLQRII